MAKGAPNVNVDRFNLPGSFGYSSLTVILDYDFVRGTSTFTRAGKLEIFVVNIHSHTLRVERVRSTIFSPTSTSDHYIMTSGNATPSTSSNSAPESSLYCSTSSPDSSWCVDSVLCLCNNARGLRDFQGDRFWGEMRRRGRWWGRAAARLPQQPRCLSLPRRIVHGPGAMP